MTAPNGFINIDVPLEPAEALARLENLAVAKGLTIFARIDHAAGAATAGLTLAPTTVLIVGNAKAGTKLMQLDQRIGIDLPLKLLVWADQKGTHIGYEDPVSLASRYDIAPEGRPIAAAMASLLEGMAEEAGRAG